MPFRHLKRLETSRSEEHFWLGVDALPVLHRAGRVIGDAATAYEANTRLLIEAELRDDFRDVASERGDPRGLFRIALIFA